MQLINTRIDNSTPTIETWLDFHERLTFLYVMDLIVIYKYILNTNQQVCL